MFKFRNENLFNAQFVRTLGDTTYQGAEIGECLAVSHRIKSNDKESWYQEWNNQANQNWADAESFAQKSLFQDARNNFLRACNYYRTAYFFLEDNPNDIRIEKTLDKSIAAFHNAMKFFDIVPEIVSIPYDTHLQMPGYLYLQPNHDKPLPLIINCAGGDGTKEDSYFMSAAEVCERGWHCLNFEGPGQGSVLRKHHIPFIPDWENVMTKVLDFVYQYPEIDKNRIIYIGRSFAGYLAVRAASREKRITACVVDPGQFDQISNLKNKLLSGVTDKSLDQILEEMTNQNPEADFSFMVKSRLWRYGVNNFKDFCQVISNYTLERHAADIVCPILVFDNEEEYLSQGQAKLLFDNLRCKKHFHRFTAAEFTGGHCQSLSPRIFYSHVFEWLHSIEFFSNLEK